MPFVKKLFSSCLFLLLPGLLLAQVREKRVAPLPAGELQKFEGSRKRAGVAILVGVGKYPTYSGFGELRYPQRDVELLDKQLSAQHYQVIPLTDGNATKESILNAITSAGEVIEPGQGTILFFFSGHGFAQGPDNMLATSDASVAKLGTTGLSLKAVEEALLATGAKRRVLWIDACRIEPGKAAGNNRSFTGFQGSSGTRILFSTKFGRVSYEDDELRQGVFSYYLVEGLKGAAAKADGWISFRDLADFVTDQVQARTLRQGRPQLPFEATGQGDASGDFAIAKLGAAAQLAADPVPQVVAPAPAVMEAKFGPFSQKGDREAGMFNWAGTCKDFNPIPCRSQVKAYFCEVIKGRTACLMDLTRKMAGSADYGGGVMMHNKLVDTFGSEYKLLGEATYLTGRGELRKTLNISTDESGWLMQEFEPVKADVSAVKIVNSYTGDEIRGVPIQRGAGAAVTTAAANKGFGPFSLVVDRPAGTFDWSRECKSFDPIPCRTKINVFFCEPIRGRTVCLLDLTRRQAGSQDYGGRVMMDNKLVDEFGGEYKLMSEATFLTGRGEPRKSLNIGQEESGYFQQEFELVKADVGKVRLVNTYMGQEAPAIPVHWPNGGPLAPVLSKTFGPFSHHADRPAGIFDWAGTCKTTSAIPCRTQIHAYFCERTKGRTSCLLSLTRRRAGTEDYGGGILVHDKLVDPLGTEYKLLGETRFMTERGDVVKSLSIADGAKGWLLQEFEELKPDVTSVKLVNGYMNEDVKNIPVTK